ncbi:MAG: 30S ribosomal protein S16 [Alphaproteobacteria bacterium]|jgi:small subunit ribosomal protein S16|nr:30S ribosomal protein S16 [Alphaproteobacteria bacterium]
MALKIRLARGGAKKRPFYRIVVAEASSPRDGRFVEKLGTYNPLLPHDHAERIVLNVERIKHWLSVGAQPTDRVQLFLGNAGLVEKKARTDDPKKSAPKKRAQERLKAEQEALNAPKPEPVVEAPAAPAVEEAPAPVVEAPAEEAPVMSEPEAPASPEEVPAAVEEEQAPTPEEVPAPVEETPPPEEEKASPAE